MDPSLRLGLELAPLPVRAGPGSPRPAGGEPGEWTWATWSAAARAAQDAGFGSVWVSGERGAGGEQACDPCTLAGALVPCTTTVTLGVVAGVGPEDRAPSVLARDLTALDVVSEGRSALLLEDRPDHGTGPGSGTGDRLVEAVAVCRALFASGRSTVEGSVFTLEDAPNLPGPIRPGGPPLLVDPGDRVPGVPGARALVVGGGPEDVAARCAAPDGAAVLWRGSLPRGGDARGFVASLAQAGARGVLLRMTDPVPPAGWPEAVAALGSVLAPLIPEWPEWPEWPEGPA